MKDGLNDNRAKSGNGVDSQKIDSSLWMLENNVTTSRRKERRYMTFAESLTAEENEGLLYPCKKFNRFNSSEVCKVTVQRGFANYKAGHVWSSVQADKEFNIECGGPAKSRRHSSLVEPLHSLPSGQHTTAFVANPLRTGTALGGTQPEPKAKHQTRQQSAIEYYEIEDNRGGTVQRQSLMRRVPQEDYLLVQGANPRTGFISPSFHVADSRQKIDILPAAGVVPPSQWRKRGDEWISLGLSEPTPVASSKDGSISQHPPLPSLKSTAVKYNRCTETDQGATACLRNDVKQQTSSVELPRAFAPTPPHKSLPIQDFVDLDKSTAIKRKPVGGTQIEQGSNIHAISDTKPKINSEMIVIQPSMPHQTRSFSAPIWQGHALKAGTASTFKLLPSLPGEKASASTEVDQSNSPVQDDPYLGMKRKEWIEDVPGFVLSEVPGSDNDLQHLRDLQMNNSQHQSSQFPAQRPIVLKHPSFLVQPRYSPKKIVGRQGGNPTHPHVRLCQPPIPLRHYHLDQHSYSIKGNPVPLYHHSPRQMTNPRRTPEHRTEALKGPSQIRNKSHPAPRDIDIFTSPPNVTYTDTNIQTPTYIPSYKFPQQQIVPSKQDYISQISPCMNRGQTSTPQSENNVEDEPIIPPRLRQRELARPQMPKRLNELHSVPKLSPRVSSQAPVINRHQWRMMNSGNADELLGSSEDTIKAKRSVSDLKLAPTQLSSLSGNQTEPANLNHQVNVDTFSKISGQTKKCSHCHNDLLGENLPSTDGHAHMPEKETLNRKVFDRKVRNDSPDRIAGSPRSANARGKGNAEDDRDHSACCTECCEYEDCHEGCLGHPSPVQSPSVSKDVIRDKDEELLMSYMTDPLAKKELASSLRSRTNLKGFVGCKPFIKKRADKISPSTEPKVRAISPAAFWGGDGSTSPDAINAARSAMVVHASLTEKMSEVAAVKAGKSVRDVHTSPNKDISVITTAEEPERSVSEHEGMLSNTTAKTAITVHSRQVSGNSLNSFEMPEMETWLELVSVPFEAAYMWINRHPNVKIYIQHCMERLMDMIKVVSGTFATLWELAYVYSKTGKLRLKGKHWSTLHCARSMIYLLLFLGLAMLVMRIARLVLAVLNVVLWFLKVLVWLIGKIGFGIIW